MFNKILKFYFNILKILITISFIFHNFNFIHLNLINFNFLFALNFIILNIITNYIDLINYEFILFAKIYVITFILINESN